MIPFCFDFKCLSSLPFPLMQCGHQSLNGRCVRRCLSTSSLDGRMGTGGALISLISSGSPSRPCASPSKVSFGFRSSPSTSSSFCATLSQEFCSGLMGQCASRFPACQKGGPPWLAPSQESSMPSFGTFLYGHAFWSCPWLSEPGELSHQ